MNNFSFLSFSSLSLSLSLSLSWFYSHSFFAFHRVLDCGQSYESVWTSVYIEKWMFHIRRAAVVKCAVVNCTAILFSMGVSVLQQSAVRQWENNNRCVDVKHSDIHIVLNVCCDVRSNWNIALNMCSTVGYCMCLWFNKSRNIHRNIYKHMCMS